MGDRGVRNSHLDCISWFQLGIIFALHGSPFYSPEYTRLYIGLPAPVLQVAMSPCAIRGMICFLSYLSGMCTFGLQARAALVQLVRV